MREAVVGADSYAVSVATAVARRTGGLTQAEADQLYGALYAAAATGSGPLVRPGESESEALARIVLDGRLGACRVCRRPLTDHDLDLEPVPVVRCRARPRPAPTRRAWLLWVGIPLLTAGLLSWVPSLMAARHHRRRGWGPATGLLAFFTLLFWAPPQDPATLVMFWLASVIYGATQVRPWLAAQAEAAPG